MSMPGPARRGGPEVALVSLMFLSVGAGLFLYGGRDWLPPLASRHGAGIDAMLHYLLLMTGTSLLVAFVVLAWLIWSGGRRARVTTRLAAHRTELLVSLVLGLAMAVIAEGGVIAIGLPVWQEYFGAARSDDAIEIDVIAQQFFWNVRYPGPDGEFGRTRGALVDEVSNPIGLDPEDGAGKDDIYLVNQFVVPVGRPVRVRLHSKDMIHSFFLPHLRVKQDVIPGMTPEITFVPTRVGTFELACAELCGLGHYRMQGMFKVVEQADYERALQEEAGR
jgi:cytochrome c oxidase subunit II